MPSCSGGGGTYRYNCIIWCKKGLTREDPEPENSKNCETLWICRGFPPEYNAIFVFCPNSLEGVEIYTWIFGFFPILYYNSRTARDRKKVSRQKLLLLIRSRYHLVKKLFYSSRVITQNRKIIGYSGIHCTCLKWIWAVNKNCVVIRRKFPTYSQRFRIFHFRVRDLPVSAKSQFREKYQ